MDLCKLSCSPLGISVHKCEISHGFCFCLLVSSSFSSLFSHYVLHVLIKSLHHKAQMYKSLKIKEQIMHIINKYILNDLYKHSNSCTHVLKLYSVSIIIVIKYIYCQGKCFGNVSLKKFTMFCSNKSDCSFCYYNFLFE